MGIGGGKRNLPTLVALLLLAGGAVLGVLQVYWVSVASRAEEVRARNSLNRGALQACTESEEEVRALLSLARVSSEDFPTRSWESFSDALAFWYAKTRFPDLLRGIYIVRRIPSGEVFSYSREKQRFLPAALPSDIARALPAALSRQDSLRFWPTVTLEGWRRMVALPVFPREWSGPPAPPVGAVVVDLDTRFFYEKVVPFYMERNLADFPYRVLAMGTGEVLAKSGEFSVTQPPEAVAAVTSLGAFVAGQPGGRGPGPDVFPGSLAFRMDPLLETWLQRTQRDAAPALQPPTPGSFPEAEARLMVYYPHGTLAGTIRAQQALNIGVSLGILGILLASVVVLSRLYRRSVVLRTHEQEFVASMSHELRTPISVIQATSENLSRGVVIDQTRLPRYAEVIHGQIRRLAGMVESILLYSGLESGKAHEPVMTEIQLPALIQEVVQSLEQLAEQRASRISLFTPSLPSSFCSDRIALRLILENLVVNAIQHAGPGEIRMAVTQQADSTLRIMVEDDGPGIPLGEHARVFEPFVRGERSVRDQHPGSGLGLHLVRRVVSLLGGKVTLESPYVGIDRAEQQGCRFTVVLPSRERCGEE
jgi:signal transduction histidine kinase